MTPMNPTMSTDELHQLIDRVEAELLELLERDAAGDDPIRSCATALALVSLADNLRRPADLVLGRILADHPDPGGKPSTPITPAREIRRMMSATRRTVVRLIREAANEPPAAESSRKAKSKRPAAAPERYRGYPRLAPKP